MILARKLRSAVKLFRRGGVGHVAEVAWAHWRAFKEANALVPRGIGRQAILLRRVFGASSDHSEVIFDEADVLAIRPSLRFPYLRRQFFDVAAAPPDPKGLSDAEIIILADSLTNRWEYQRLDTAIPAWRLRLAGTKFAEALDQMARRASLRLGRLSVAAAGLPLSGGDLAACLLRAEIFDAQGRVEDAALALQQAAHRDPGHPGVRLLYGFHLLRRGRLLDGLANWGIAEEVLKTYPLRPSQRQWAGEDLNGRSLLVIFEHGLGDMIQLARFLRPLRALYPDATIHCVVPPPLVGLLARSFRDVNVVSTEAEEPVCDYHCPSVQLALILEAPDLSPVAGYIDLGPGQSKPAPREAKRVGICWRGHPRHYELSRSISIEAFAPLLSRRDVDFVVLLNTLTTAETTLLERLPHVQIPAISDFAALADVIGTCDLVVSVDTAVPHVAAAGGKPVLLLSRPDACWRWGPAGSRSPWYSSVEVLRHPGDMDWSAVLTEAGRRLSTAFDPASAAAPEVLQRQDADAIG